MLDIKDAKFLVERETNRIVGIKEIDGDEVYLPTFATDASGNVTGLVGAGGETINMINHPYSALSSTVTLGDSKMAYGFDVSGGTTSQSIIGWCNDLLAAYGDVGFDVVANYAVSGHTLDNVISTQLTPALANTAEVAWVHAGVNNLNSSLGQNDSVSSILDKYATIIQSLAAYKKLVIIDSIEPILQTGSTGAKGRAFTIPTVNAGVARICAQYTNVIYNDTYTPMLDTTSALLNPISGTVDSTDGIHQNSTGAYLAGHASYKTLVNKIRLTRYKTAGANLLPTFSGTGGTVTSGGFITVTGTPPVGWELLGVSGASASHSLTISTLAPDYVRLTFANTGASAATTYLRVNNYQASVTRNTTVQGGFGFQCSGNTGLNRIACNLRVNGSGAAGYLISGMGQSGQEATITYPQTAHGGVRKTSPFVLPDVALTNFEYIIAFNIAGTSGASTVDLYAPTLVNLTS